MKDPGKKANGKWSVKLYDVDNANNSSKNNAYSFYHYDGVAPTVSDLKITAKNPNFTYNNVAWTNDNLIISFKVTDYAVEKHVDNATINTVSISYKVNGVSKEIKNAEIIKEGSNNVKTCTYNALMYDYSIITDFTILVKDKANNGEPSKLTPKVEGRLDTIAPSIQNVQINSPNPVKYTWKDTKQYLNYLLDDTTRAFIKMDENFSYEDFDIFVSDSTKDNQAIEQLKSLIQPAMQNGASLLDAAEILTMDNLSMIKNKLQEIEAKRIEQQQALQEQEAQQQQQLVQMQNQVKEEELMLKEAELDLEKYKIDQDNATKITVAQLNAYRNAENMDQDGNGIPDPVEIGKQEIERQKAVSDAQAKQMDLANKMRAEENKKEIERRKVEAQKDAEKLKATIEREKIALEKKKLEEARKLQKQKDDAAYKREQLKARTALKNKVVGEGKSKTKK